MSFTVKSQIRANKKKDLVDIWPTVWIPGDRFRTKSWKMEIGQGEECSQHAKVKIGLAQLFDQTRYVHPVDREGKYHSVLLYVI